MYKELGYSPNAAEYDKIAETEFKLRVLYKNNIKLNQLKEVAGIPKRTPGYEKGKQTSTNRLYIYCLAHKGKIADKECVPGYKEKFCKGCKVKQKDNAKSISNIPDEIEQLLKHQGLHGNKYMNGNDVYLTDDGVI